MGVGGERRSPAATLTLALCNEVVRELELPAQFELAARLGYDAVELAPFTLADDPRTLTSADADAIVRAAAAAGVRVSSLHWLLTAPAGLSITSADAEVRRRTLEVMTALIRLCRDLGGSVLVHGSPQQRRLGADDPEGDRARAVAAFAAAAREAERCGVTYCIEPLSRHETAFVTSVAEASKIVNEIASPALRTMLDTRAARLSEAEPVEDVLAAGLASGLIAHVHLNDSSGLGPGQGADDLTGVLRTLAAAGYGGVAAVEPFTYTPDGPTSAAFAAGYVRGLWAGVSAPATRTRPAAPPGGPPG